MLVHEKGLMLSKGGGIGIRRLLLGVLDQQRLVLGKEGLLLLRREGRRSLTRPHVYGAGPGVLWRGPWCASPS
jgi:hypothetical protein